MFCIISVGGAGALEDGGGGGEEANTGVVGLKQSLCTHQVHAAPRRSGATIYALATRAIHN